MKPLIAVMGPHGSSLLYNSVGISTISLNEAYADSVTRAGGIPVIIPPLADREDLFRLVECCDGVLFPGGEDVDPRFYHQAPSAKLGRVNKEFDAAWIAVGQRAAERGMPILGICRGLQIMNVALGGSLYQDISEAVSKPFLHSQKQVRSYPMHPVSVEPDTLLHNLLGEDVIYTNTMHHQSVHQPGAGLTVTARTEDGVIEGLENDSGSILLVQWHPEELQDSVPCMQNLFRHLICKAEAFHKG